jgi:nicotinamide mononucleotide adenylyltransferase
VQGICPPFDLVYCNDELVRLLFHKAGYKTMSVPRFSKREYSYDFIMDGIIKHKPWEHLLPPAAAEIMREYKLDERLRWLFEGSSIAKG